MPWIFLISLTWLVASDCPSRRSNPRSTQDPFPPRYHRTDDCKAVSRDNNDSESSTYRHNPSTCPSSACRSLQQSSSAAHQRSLLHVHVKPILQKSPDSRLVRQRAHSALPIWADQPASHARLTLPHTSHLAPTSSQPRLLLRPP